MSNQLIKPFQYKRIPLTSTEQTETIPNNHKKAKPRDWKNTLRRIWLLLAQHRMHLFIVGLFVVISSALSLLGPFLVGMAIDEFLVTHNVNGLLQLLMYLFLIYISYSISIWLQNFLMIGIAQKTVYEMRRQLFTRLQKLPISYLDKRQHGELMSRLTNDMENVSTTLNSSVIQILSSVLTFIGIISVMLWLSPLLTVITLAVIPLMVFGLKWITKRTSVFFKEQQKHLGEVNGYIEETITGQKIVKAFSREEHVIASFAVKNEKLKGAGFWAQTYSGFIPKLMNVLNNLSFAFIAGIGGILAFYQLITIGVIVIFAEYSRQFTRPLNDLANQFNTLLSAVAGAERVFEIIDEEEERDHPHARQVSSIQGDVSFEHVSFSYEANQKTIEDVSFQVRAGETVALVGPTGAGKTTIINLLSRFYEPSEGRITIDGVDLNDIQLVSLRQHIGIVLQDTYLFQGTIKENIRYGKLEASDEEVMEAAKKANAHSFISKLSNGYETVLNQDGSGISQGQKQLLSIARVMLANPSLLILDEATSSIDTMTEMNIQIALKRLMEGRTSFVIAHRLNTIKEADQIIVLKNGKLFEKGTHEQLLKHKGYYYDMCNRS
ncbi:lipid A export ATP-binding/permease protein MsbA [Halalkalibacter wakoensis JCM 9140]|uniref:Lipid A export ATP-binding/permease protein MsbA n=1 Tax=Halalkalibacter wakoensis JCM 9140 TaxID=1236970 RepID=W4Q207_9BACI|nr:ABC transporter ATP-binding protein [Halalkalibacter wakoensis]GAE26111.1 lipid A export ATP-binding/permease protein MsbA [Halalkalibacter wakoensis JCM 9140]